MKKPSFASTSMLNAKQDQLLKSYCILPNRAAGSLRKQIQSLTAHQFILGN